ncbi:MAG: sigma 54-interacting transcriptional regulator [Ignavibacteriaceae bacterium]|jgi:transcriptional regulator with GAF, ATPase, and Fis domain/CHASE2 domain-containing sensor protein
MFTSKWNKQFVIKTFVVLTVFVSTIFYTGLTNSANSLCKSVFKNIRGEVLPDTNVVLITISGNDIEQLGGWPLKRSYYALLINELNKYEVKKIGIEVFFSGRNSIQTMYDHLFISQIKAANNVVLSSVPGSIYTKNNIYHSEEMEYPSLKEIDTSLITGHLGLLKDGVIPLQIDDEKSFAAQLTGSKRTDEIKVNVTSSWKSFHQYELLEFFSLVKQSSPSLQQLRGKIILIGVSDEKFTKKLSSSFDTYLPGIAFHAFAVSNLLQNNWVKESLFSISILIHLLLLVLFVFLFEKKTAKSRYEIAALFIFILVIEFLFFSFFNYELHFASFVLPFFSLLILELALTFSERNSLFETTISESEALKHLLTKKEHDLDELQKHSTFSSLAEKENLKEKIELLQKEISRLEKQGQNELPYTPKAEEKISENFCGILYRSKVMRDVVAFIKKAAPTNETVLILGESGTGKELVAKALHQNSSRKDAPFIAVNCGALSETLLESELFGHVKGAFTGAAGDKIGRFEAADKGTIFLDEIGETSENFQVKLLRVLQSGEFEKVGSAKTFRVDVRIIAATNKKLDQMVKEKKFREDLFYRLNVFPIQLPPLRERKEDIPEIVEGILKLNSKLTGISKAAMEILLQHDWRGNVRELESALKRAFVFANAEQRKIIQLADLPEDVVKEKRLHYEELVLDALRQKKFSHSAFSEIASELEVNRTLISENFRGLSFKLLVKNNFDVENTINELAATDDEQSLEKVKAKLETFLSNIREDAKKAGSTDIKIVKQKLQSKYKNLPKKFHPYLDEVIKHFLV